MIDRARLFRRTSRHIKEAVAERKNDPPPSEPPSAQRFIVGDATVEALIPLLQDNPRGLLLARDELNGWFGSIRSILRRQRLGFLILAVDAQRREHSRGPKDRNATDDQCPAGCGVDNGRNPAWHPGSGFGKGASGVWLGSTTATCLPLPGGRSDGLRPTLPPRRSRLSHNWSSASSPWNQRSIMKAMTNLLS